MRNKSGPAARAPAVQNRSAARQTAQPATREPGPVLEPNNIIAVPGAQAVKLTDFGIATVLSRAPQAARPPTS